MMATAIAECDVISNALPESHIKSFVPPERFPEIMSSKQQFIFLWLR